MRFEGHAKGGDRHGENYQAGAEGAQAAKAKAEKGRLLVRIEGTYGEWFDRVTLDGKELTPEASQQVRNHSPDGFAWGYSGSGPAQLALAILLAAGLRPDEAQQVYQRFKAQHIASLPDRSSFVLELDVKAWALQELGRRRSIEEAGT